MIQYHHGKNVLGDKRRYTVAVDIPDISFIKKILHSDIYKSMFLPIGMSVCSPIDNFEKRVGRELAVSRLKSTECILTCVDFESDFTFYHFKAPSLHLILKTKRGKLKVHLVQAKVV